MFVGAKFYCPHALAEGKQSTRIGEKTLEFSSTVLSTLSPYLQEYSTCQQAIAPGAARRYALPADSSSTLGGSTSVRGRVRSPHISGGRPAAGSQRADSLGTGWGGSCATQPACYSLGWDRQTDRQTDGRIAVSLNARYGGGLTINKLANNDGDSSSRLYTHTRLPV